MRTPALALLALLLSSLVSVRAARIQSRTEGSAGRVAIPGTTRRALIGSAPKLLFHYERWKAGIEGGLAAPLVLPLGWSKGRSQLFTRARGEAVVDVAARTLTVSATGLGPPELDGGAALEVWLEPYSVVALDPLLLGTLPITDGAGMVQLGIDPALSALELEGLVLARPGQGPGAGGILFGLPDLFQRLAALELSRVRPLRGREVGGIPLAPPAGSASDPGWSAAALDELVADGERLFFEETFEGNGRTCGTCHPAENNFTIDPDFISTLPADDPLFVAENLPALDARQNGGLVFESPVHMRRFGLIVENVDGFDDLRKGFVLRAVQPTLGLAATIEPQPLNQPLRHLTGWGGDGAPGRGSLREFAQGAVRQHFPRTLERREGADFRLPRADELSALEGFQLSLGRTEDPDIAAHFTSPAVRRGVQAFVFQGACNFCHINGGGRTVGASGPGAAFIDTGVEALEQHSLDRTGLVRPVDGGFGTTPEGAFGESVPLPEGGFGNRRFNVPSLIELADTLPAFHSHVSANQGSGLANTVEGSIEFYNSPEFAASEVGGLIVGLTPGEIADIGSFLRVLNALENLRTVEEYVERAREESALRAREENAARARRLIRLALLENEDALQVLGEVGLHPVVRAELRAVETRLRFASDAPPAERFAELGRVLSGVQRARASMVD